HLSCTLFPYTTLFRSVVRTLREGRQADDAVSQTLRESGALVIERLQMLHRVLVAAEEQSQVRLFLEQRREDITQEHVEAALRTRSEEHTSELQSRSDL